VSQYADTSDLEPMQDYSADDAWEDRHNFDRDVADELRHLKIRKAAQEALRAESEPPAPPFDAGTLGEILARPADPPMRVDGLIPWDSSTLIAAQRKTGKTTLELNLARSLLTGEDFLGKFAVRPVVGIVAVLNFEVSAAMLAHWANEHGIDRDRFYQVNLRGRRNPFTHPRDRELLAADLRARGVESLIVDPFGRAYPGKSQNDSGEVGSWLVDLDMFARSEVGAKDVILTAHAGWNGERTRGSSALEDWPDSIITMTRDADDDSLRFLRAEGRDVELAEDRLDFNPSTRTLSLAGTGSRKKGKSDRKTAELAVLAVRAAHTQPGIGVAEMVAAIRLMDDAPTFQDRDVSKAARHAADLGHLRLEGGGPGKKTSHFATPSNPVQTPSTDVLSNPVHPVYRDGVGVGGSAQPMYLDGVTPLKADDSVQICGICQTREAPPGRGICSKCDADQASKSARVKAAS